MKNLFTILISLLLISFTVKAQHGYMIHLLGEGNLYNIDLTSAEKTLIGTTINELGAGDLASDNYLYAIAYMTNNFYKIDTVDGSTTLVGVLAAPSGHVWTGMAYDEEADIMYGNSSNGNSECSLHIIDISNVTSTLVGTQTDAGAIACIAIDGTGQMYGVESGGNADLYSIDKTNASVTLIGSMGVGVAGMGQGLDYCIENETMYMTNYNSISFENTLRVVDLTTGSTTQVGEEFLGNWTGLIAIPSTSAAVIADFVADVTDICAGEEVSYTDLSVGATSWLWTFEGGDPASSTVQNPTVTYNSAGVFDVTLQVTNGINTDTKYVADMITVTDIPMQPSTPEGPAEVCQNVSTSYQINPLPDADLLIWALDPPEAGEISGDGENISIAWSVTYLGTAYLSVYGINDCGDGSISDPLEITVDDCTGIMENVDGKISFYPNPAKDQLNIAFTTNSVFTYEINILSQFGTQVYTAKGTNNAGEGSTQINLESLATGLYFVKIVTSTNKTYQYKLEIVK